MKKLQIIIPIPVPLNSQESEKVSPLNFTEFNSYPKINLREQNLKFNWSNLASDVLSPTRNTTNSSNNSPFNNITAKSFQRGQTIIISPLKNFLSNSISRLVNKVSNLRQSRSLDKNFELLQAKEQKIINWFNDTKVYLQNLISQEYINKKKKLNDKNIFFMNLRRKSQDLSGINQNSKQYRFNNLNADIQMHRKKLLASSVIESFNSINNIKDKIDLISIGRKFRANCRKSSTELYPPRQCEIIENLIEVKINKDLDIKKIKKFKEFKTRSLILPQMKREDDLMGIGKINGLKKIQDFTKIKQEIQAKLLKNSEILNRILKYPVKNQIEKLKKTFVGSCSSILHKKNLTLNLNKIKA